MLGDEQFQHEHGALPWNQRQRDLSADKDVGGETDDGGGSEYSVEVETTAEVQASLRNSGESVGLGHESSKLEERADENRVTHEPLFRSVFLFPSQSTVIPSCITMNRN